VSGYLLDTSPLAALLHNREAAVSLIRPWLLDHEAATSILAYGEVIEYLKPHADYARRAHDLRQLLRGVTPYALTYAIMARYAELRLRMRRPYGPGLIGDVDTLIAATALEHRLNLVTTDTDFQRVPDLSVLLLDRDTLKIRP